MSTDCLFSMYRKLLGPDAFMWFRGQLYETLPGRRQVSPGPGLLVCRRKIQSSGQSCSRAALCYWWGLGPAL